MVHKRHCEVPYAKDARPDIREQEATQQAPPMDEEQDVERQDGLAEVPILTWVQNKISNE